MALPVSFHDCVRLVQSIQAIANQVRINKRHSQHLAWRVGLVNGVLARAQQKVPPGQLGGVPELTVLKGVLVEGESLLSQFVGKRWFSRIQKRANDCEAFLTINQKLDASVQVLLVELALKVNFQEFNPVRLEIDDEEDAARDAVTVTELQAEEKNEAFMNMLAEWKAYLEVKQNLSKARRAAARARELKRDELEKGARIGQGGFGIVYEGRWQGTPVAIKELPCSSELSEEEKQAFREEAACHADLKHPNVVLVFGSCADESPFYLVMELMRGGSLQSLIRNRVRGLAGAGGMPFPIAVAMSVCLQIARAMVFLHSRGIIHRDLKAANVLVNILDKITGACTAKVADFGVATLKTATTLHRTRAGTCRWMAPEILDDLPYMEKTDVYSFAMTCVEVLTGTVPFSEIKSEAAVIRAVDRGVRPKFPEGCPAELRALIEDCWNQDPRARPEFRQVCTRLEGLGAREVPELTAVENSNESDSGGAQDSATSPLGVAAEFTGAPQALHQIERPAQSLQGVGEKGDKWPQPPTSSRQTTEQGSVAEHHLAAHERDPNADQAQALRYSTLAAEATAQLEMGHRSNDAQLALKCFEKAAKQGDGGAQFALARCYELERGKIGATTQASPWYAKAVKTWGLFGLAKWFLQNPTALLSNALQVDKFRLALLHKILELKVADLEKCSLGAEALAAALEHGPFLAPQTLNLRANSIGEGGARALAASLERGSFLEVQTLDLRANSIGEAGTRALAAALERGSFPALQTLILTFNAIGDVGAQALAATLERGSLPALQTLSLLGNHITEAGARALAGALERGCFSALQALTLSNNPIGGEGARALAAALERGSFPELWLLDLSNSSIGDAGARAMAAALEHGSFPVLDKLDLASNSIGDEGARALAASLQRGSLPALRVLFLICNPIGEEGARALAAAPVNVTF